MRCSKCGQEIKEAKILKIAGFEITNPVECNTYEEAKKCPKGFRLPTRGELFTLFDSRDKNLVKVENVGLYWSSTIYENCVRRLFLGRSLDVYSNYGNLAVSNSDGRVVFVRFYQVERGLKK